ncbi:MAG: hypothetical protein WA040_02850 [Anaerolineae bacterium]
MDARYHVEITRNALAGQFDEAALAVIVRANLRQDRPATLVGHPEIHFDASAFAAGEAYIAQQQRLAVSALDDLDDRPAALAAFGRLLHGRQDFYAHSNWAALWVAAHGGLERCAPEEIQPCLDPLAIKGLVSGKGSVRHFVACRVPLYGRWHRQHLLPADDHEAMNLDSPARGPLFAFAVAAAVKHSRWELDALLRMFGQVNVENAVGRFVGRVSK